MREQTEAMRLPRFLWVPFELGRPFGAPHEPDFQRRVLHDALALVERTDGPVVLADFPDDAPVGDDEVVWACPVSYSSTLVGEHDLVADVRAEIATLAPWAELAQAPAPNSSATLDELVDLLAGTAAGDEAADLEAIRLAADDLRTWYLHAFAQQPGRATSTERNSEFWRETALGHLLGRLTRRLLDDPEPLVRMYADRSLVPRDHWDLLVPDSLEENP